LEPRIRELWRRHLDEALGVFFFGTSADAVIAELLGIPAEDWPWYRRWSDAILAIANTFAQREAAERIFAAKETLPRLRGFTALCEESNRLGVK
jgi:hypothetical protein